MGLGWYIVYFQGTIHSISWLHNVLINQTKNQDVLKWPTKDIFDDVACLISHSAGKLCLISDSACLCICIKIASHLCYADGNDHWLADGNDHWLGPFVFEASQ